MNTIKETRGGRRAGAGRKPTPSTQLKDAIEGINIPKIVKNLEKWSAGHEVICPHCQEHTGIYVPDTVALQSGIELMNRRLGKPVTKAEVSITEHIILTADQIDNVLRNHLPQVVQMYLQEILGILEETKQLPVGPVVEGEWQDKDGGWNDSTTNDVN